MMYEYLLWRLSANSVKKELELNQSERNNKYYFMVYKLTVCRMRDFETCLVTNFINRHRQKYQMEEMPTVLLNLIAQYIKSEPKGT